jgi:signal peptidase II
LFKTPGRNGKRGQPLIFFFLVVCEEDIVFNFVMYFFLVLGIYTFDQVSKFFIRNNFFLGESHPVINDFFHLTLVHNSGAAFGICRSFPRVFSCIAGGSVVIIMILLVVKRKELELLEKLSLSFILSGTLGNLTDRVRFGYVIDFLDFRVWPVFNIADSFITIGAFILGISLISRSYTNRRKT